MSVTKRINGSYTITNKDPGGLFSDSNITIQTDTLYVAGNLVVGGNSSSLVRTNTYITDNILTLNEGESGNGVSAPGYSGIAIDRGTAANVALRWNESGTRWELTNNGTNYYAITVGTTTAISNVYADSAPAISANLDLRGHDIWDSTNLQANVSLGNVSAGGTGFYSNTALGNHELISKRLALIYLNLLG